jgi:hypothetical protein
MTLAEELDDQVEEYSKYYNKTTREIILVSFEDIRIAEDSEEDDDFQSIRTGKEKISLKLLMCL